MHVSQDSMWWLLYHFLGKVFGTKQGHRFVFLVGMPKLDWMYCSFWLRSSVYLRCWWMVGTWILLLMCCSGDLLPLQLPLGHFTLVLPLLQLICSESVHTFILFCILYSCVLLSACSFVCPVEMLYRDQRLFFFTCLPAGFDPGTWVNVCGTNM